MNASNTIEIWFGDVSKIEWQMDGPHNELVEKLDHNAFYELFTKVLIRDNNSGALAEAKNSAYLLIREVVFESIEMLAENATTVEDLQKEIDAL